MPLWLEQFVNEHAWVMWSPLVVCVVGAGALWVWRSLLDDMEAQLGKETDADVKAMLTRLVAEIKTEKPAQAVK